ncbi:MAG TPA: Gfo/Idh/MocA family oxidoreductase [Candidatus Dormibacteraeota bacterium]|nr:Gfo/Idh/MocA family oxidoreductase [Candidatus Dormibacteraeota bacterium]
MNGVTGRMGSNQHLARSIAAIRADGGVPIDGGRVIWPDPILVGRDAAKLADLAASHGIDHWSTDLDACLANPAYSVYFDAQTTDRRASAVRQAIAAGKHIYCEKPTAPDLATAAELARLASRAGVRHGVVQDKLWLPGFRTLKKLIDDGFFGRILSVRGEFGYWVFEGFDGQVPQRPSWNYRAQDGGGIIIDMFCHWRYLLDNLFGPVKTVLCLGATHIPERVDEAGLRYPCTADDAAYAIFETETGVIIQMNSAWTVRVRRDDLFVLQVDGTEGSATVGLRKCLVQTRSQTPRATWNPDLDLATDLWAGWQEVPPVGPQVNAFRAQWELFLKHVVCGDAFSWNLDEAAKAVQLADLGVTSWRERRWVDVPELSLD